MCDRPYTSEDKWIAASMAGLIFLLLASPYSFSLSSKYIGRGLLDQCWDGTAHRSECCSDSSRLIGLLLHAGLFVLLLYLLMTAKGRAGSAVCERPYTSSDRWIVSLIGGVIFMVLASPFMFTILAGVGNMILPQGYALADACGNPSLLGLALATGLFIGAVRILIR